jgi:hypothetical protein
VLCAALVSRSRQTTRLFSGRRPAAIAVLSKTTTTTAAATIIITTTVRYHCLQNRSVNIDRAGLASQSVGRSVDSGKGAGHSLSWQHTTNQTLIGRDPSIVFVLLIHQFTHNVHRLQRSLTHSPDRPTLTWDTRTQIHTRQTGAHHQPRTSRVDRQACWQIKSHRRATMIMPHHSDKF